MKNQTFQYLQQLRNNPKIDNTLLACVSPIHTKLSERKSHVVKASAIRSDKIKSLKQDIESKKKEYYTKCKILVDSYNLLESKINLIDSHNFESMKCSSL
jgi:TRAP-type uncharacterized transport system substrate-binding protein